MAPLPLILVTPSLAQPFLSFSVYIINSEGFHPILLGAIVRKAAATPAPPYKKF